MSLYPVQPSFIPQPASQAGAADTRPSSAAQAGYGDATDTVHLSSQARIMSQVSGSDPSLTNAARRMSTALTGDLQAMFRKAPVGTNNAVSISVNSQTGQLAVQGGRADAQSISDLITGNPAVLRQIQDISTLSAQAAAAEQSAAVNQVGQSAARAARIGNVVSDYAARFSDTQAAPGFSMSPIDRQASTPAQVRVASAYSAVANSPGGSDVSLTFTGTELHVDVNGRRLVSAKA